MAFILWTIRRLGLKYIGVHSSLTERERNANQDRWMTDESFLFMWLKMLTLICHHCCPLLKCMYELAGRVKRIKKIKTKVCWWHFINLFIYSFHTLCCCFFSTKVHGCLPLFRCMIGMLLFTVMKKAVKCSHELRVGCKPLQQRHTCRFILLYVVLQNLTNENFCLMENRGESYLFKFSVIQSDTNFVFLKMLCWVLIKCCKSKIQWASSLGCSLFIFSKAHKM